MQQMIVKNRVNEDLTSYNELINYLTLYVNLQEAIVDKIKITVSNNEYTITDSKNRQIFDIIKYDDTLLDLLISIAPKKIIIYNIENFNNKDLLKTIISIFKERVDVCCGNF